MKKYLLPLLSLIPALMTAQNHTVRVEAGDSEQTIIEKATSVVPTKNQLAALDNGFIAFIHFGPNTFTGREWGDGMEDPKVFDLKNLDTDQWCRVMADAGMKMVVITVKHHDGFVLWQSRYTDHGIMSTNFMDGKGDILKSLSESCRKYGLKLGVYLSPADLYQIESPNGLYGNLSKKTLRTIPRPVEGRPFKNKTTFQFTLDDYNEYFLSQLFELLTEYGPIHEVWLDGANPKEKGGQKYDYTSWRELIRTLAPEATIFGREDLRWVGNEGGFTRDYEWNAIPYASDPNTMTEFPDYTGDINSEEAIAKWTAPFYFHYQPTEVDTSIREGWFYRNDPFQKIRNADDVFDIYERSVGGNGIFILNIPPNTDGVFSDKEVSVLAEVGKRIREVYSTDLLAGSDRDKVLNDNDLSTFVSLASPLTITLPQPVLMNRLMLQEPVSTSGERIRNVSIELKDTNGEWHHVADTRNIGYKRIVRFPDFTATAVRLTTTDVRAFEPLLASISAHYYCPSSIPDIAAARDENGKVSFTRRPYDFFWNRGHVTSSNDTIDSRYSVYYTTDLSEPTEKSNLYTGPFDFTGGTIKSRAFLNGEAGNTSTDMIGLNKTKWSIVNASSANYWHPAKFAIDEDSFSFWLTEETDTKPCITIDLGEMVTFNAFRYTPQTRLREGHMESGIIETSTDGKTWKKATEFTFGNIFNQPTPRLHQLDKPVKARYLRIIPTVIAQGDKVVSIAAIDLYNL